MPGLKDFLRKKEKIGRDENAVPQNNLNVPELKLIKITTDMGEEGGEVNIPDYPESIPEEQVVSPRKKRQSEYRHLGFRKSSNADLTRDPTAILGTGELPTKPKDERRLSHRLHLRRQSRSPSESSTHLPDDLPDAPSAVEPSGPVSVDATEEKQLNEQREAQWEKRATILAQTNPLLEQDRQQPVQEKPQGRSRSRSPTISDKGGDENIQEAIRLHETGELGLSTAMFGRLGDPNGANNALAQVLYGLALRHGWGVPPEPEKAIHYLSLAASNSAAVERAALESGMSKGGAAKGELVLAIFELANCFRHGWGVKKDPPAARNYYETAANLGDTDAMDEAAWCYLQGFGGGKDKFKAAQYLRLAEQRDHKSVGNSWIWKEKYDSPK